MTDAAEHHACTQQARCGDEAERRVEARERKVAGPIAAAGFVTRTRAGQDLGLRAVLIAGGIGAVALPLSGGGRRERERERNEESRSQAAGPRCKFSRSKILDFGHPPRRPSWAAPGRTRATGRQSSVEDSDAFSEDAGWSPAMQAADATFYAGSGYRITAYRGLASLAPSSLP